MTTSASSAAFGLRPFVYLSGFGCACAMGGLGGPEGVEEGVVAMDVKGTILFVTRLPVLKCFVVLKF